MAQRNQDSMQHLGAPPPGITSRRGTARDDPNTKSDAMRSLEVRFLLPQASEGCDVHGKPCVQLPLNYPVARPQLAFRPIRLERKELRDAFTWYIQSSQRLQGKPVLPGCTWCGLPTGGFCDVCTQCPANAVCSDCGGTDVDIEAQCRQCAEEEN